MARDDFETFKLGPYTVPRLWIGLWQLSSPAWGTAPVSKIKAEMHAHLSAGYTTFDMADHYGSAEIIFGQFRQACINNNAGGGSGASSAHTPSPPNSNNSSPNGRATAAAAANNRDIITTQIEPTNNATTTTTNNNNQKNSGGASTTIAAAAAAGTSNGTVPICADKWCIFRNPSTPLTLETTEEAVRERMQRTAIADGIDILQIHWQDYSSPQVYLDVFRQLLELRNTRRIRIDVLGLVNFDTKRVIEICEAMGPGEILTNQIQFSLIDVRPLYGMTDACKKHGVKLLTYGTFCGGFLADKWLGRAQPDPYRDHITPSQRKYLDVILNAWGGWDLFQSLLSVLRSIADSHSTETEEFSIANVATRWVLDQPAVGAVIVGARLGVSEHRADNEHTFSLRLNPDDHAAISAVLARSNGHNLINLMGDCGSEYR